MKNAVVLAAVLEADVNGVCRRYQPFKLRGPAASDQVAR